MPLLQSPLAPPEGQPMPPEGMAPPQAQAPQQMPMQPPQQGMPDIDISQFIEEDRPSIPTAMAEYINSRNLVEELSDDILSDLKRIVKTEYEIDKSSMREWLEKYDEVKDTVTQKLKPKTTPWVNCANVIHPMIHMAAMQFAARAYPEFCKGGRAADAKPSVTDNRGFLTKIAKAIGEHLSWQLMEQCEYWEGELDTLLNLLPITGIFWRKVMWDHIRDVPDSRLVSPNKVVVNYWSPIGEYPKRITHEIEYYLPDILSYVRDGLWVDPELHTPTGEHADSTDRLGPWDFIEQHTRYDIDGDGYPEPIVVTMEVNEDKIVRVVNNIDECRIKFNDDGDIVYADPVKWFQDYHFVPAPDGSFFSVGFGILQPLNGTVNTIFNNLLDAGTLANLGGGFIARGAGIRPGGERSIYLGAGEWKTIDIPADKLKDGLIPRPTVEPSQVLFQLLQLLLETTSQFSTVSDETVGMQSHANEPATSVLARIEEGMKFFSAIHRRIYRSLKGELSKLAELNRKYLRNPTLRQLYQATNILVVPVADPNIASDMQRLAKAQAGLSITAQCGGPLVVAGRKVLEAMNMTDAEVDEYLPQNTQAPPDPKMAQVQSQAMIARAKQQGEMQIAMTKLQAEGMLAEKKSAFELEREKLIHERELRKVAAQIELDKERANNQMEIEKMKAEMQKQVEEMKAEFSAEVEMMKAENEIAIKKLIAENEMETKRQMHAMELEMKLYEQDNKAAMEHDDMECKAEMEMKKHSMTMDMQRKQKEWEMRFERGEITEEEMAKGIEKIKEQIKQEMRDEREESDSEPAEIIYEGGKVSGVRKGKKEKRVIRDSTGQVISIR